jgi:arylformamidase
MEIYDISVPIRRGMIVYEGDPFPHVHRVSAIADGDVANSSRLDFGVHTGTHVDAPVHFIDGAPGADALPLEVLLGPAEVVDATGADASLDGAAVDRLAIPGGVERVLLKTRNSALWERDTFSAEFVALTADAAEALVRRGVRLVGIDYLSIAPFGDPVPTHVALLSAGVVILEGLDLRSVTPGHYELACLPLRIEGADGAPARAVLIRDDAPGT